MKFEHKYSLRNNKDLINNIINTTPNKPDKPVTSNDINNVYTNVSIEATI